ncbi:MAG: RsmD family RNA methyltransferase, partial [Pontimonas sp.]
MTRIIAGEAGSLRLTAPDKVSRPTSDRVREAIFSRLESLMNLRGSRVLDLFAGTGALGLEAASRGASAV